VHARGLAVDGYFYFFCAVFIVAFGIKSDAALAGVVFRIDQVEFDVFKDLRSGRYF